MIFQVTGQFDEFIENFNFFRSHPSFTVGKRSSDDLFLTRTNIDHRPSNILDELFQFSETKFHNSSDRVVVSSSISIIKK